MVPWVRSKLKPGSTEKNISVTVVSLFLYWNKRVVWGFLGVFLCGVVWFGVLFVGFFFFFTQDRLAQLILINSVL